MKDGGLMQRGKVEICGVNTSKLKVLKNDKRAIFSAAGHAQKAVDYLLELQPSP